MSEPKSLLIEIGCEELPIHAIDELAQAFARGVCEGLSKRGISAGVEHARAFCTPRRLAVHVPAVGDSQPEQHSEALGPYVNIALDAQGEPTRALLGFAQKCGVEWTQLQRVSDNKGERFAHRAVQPGQTTAALLPQIVSEALAALPIPKPMRWGDHDYAFVRPVHWLVMLHGDRVVEGEVLGLKSGRQSRGHRFMHAKSVHLVDADSYLDSLRAAKVLADPAGRRARVREHVAAAAQANGGGDARLSNSLCDEIANLTEWPVAIACTFDRDYLAVPHEALVMTMETNQKFVPVFDAQGKLTERFIGVANVESKEPALIRHGYERVIRPRFADAKFFFDEDLKTPLAAHQQGLAEVTWQKALGSLWDKTVRVAELARLIANRLREQGFAVDAALTTHAAGLSRCDLLTRMVGEFPELQGVMGRHYAAAQGEREDVADALDQFYRPRNAGDGIAQGVMAQALSVADKLDTLAGIFAVGLKPSGNKDPFALRRAALGLARTLIEGGLDLDLDVLLRDALEQIPTLPSPSGRGAGGEGTKLVRSAESSRAELAAELRAFILDRLRGYYAEQGYTPGQFAAVAAVEPASLVDFDRRLRAVAAFAKRAEAESLAAANKRVANILRKEGVDIREAGARAIDESLLQESAERTLWQALQSAQSETRSASDYEGTLARLAQLQAPVDAFFDGVLVMAEDAALRGNRLALLARIKARFDAIADIALL
ncbi:MAG TPA: glycine--tRNA ligase subunit beta [Rhodanobacteraceae bacterium]|nr:glycine--tRNA ligase subunit beta [Rhodanobacteraceae bacterium]